MHFASGGAASVFERATFAARPRPFEPRSSRRRSLHRTKHTSRRLHRCNRCVRVIIESSDKTAFRRRRAHRPSLAHEITDRKIGKIVGKKPDKTRLVRTGPTPSRIPAVNDHAAYPQFTTAGAVTNSSDTQGAGAGELQQPELCCVAGAM